MKTQKSSLQRATMRARLVIRKEGKQQKTAKIVSANQIGHLSCSRIKHDAIESDGSTDEPMGKLLSSRPPAILLGTFSFTMLLVTWHRSSEMGTVFSSTHCSYKYFNDLSTFARKGYFNVQISSDFSTKILDWPNNVSISCPWSIMSTLELSPLNPTQVAHNYPAQISLSIVPLSHGHRRRWTHDG